MVSPLLQVEPETRDAFFNGRIFFTQPKDGYRFSIDAVILSHLSRPAPDARVLDLGTGCGVIPIMMAFRQTDLRLVGVEIQPALAGFARQNVAENKMADRIRILEKDMTELSLEEVEGPVDLVVTNPPYRKLDSGRCNPNPQRAMARHELKIDLSGLMKTARRMLRQMGRLMIIYPSIRMADLLLAMRACQIEPKEMTLIHSDAKSPANRVVVTGIHGGRPGLSVMPPIRIYQPDGTYTPAVATMFAG
ncbi:methyltransferase [Desulfosarcina sp. OttesenSCG-928-A07]|nr:methyltransferase [Desulfosarcina sp. OttesenSCG-928-G17]MDL2328711.1 methyltransferase [Desulfosarcina sp. OttesenSCG-928-A07]